MSSTDVVSIDDPDLYIDQQLEHIHDEGLYALETDEAVEEYARVKLEHATVWRRLRREVRACVKKEISDLKVSEADNWAARVEKKAAALEQADTDEDAAVFELGSEAEMSRHLERDVTDEHRIVFDYGHFHKYDPDSGLWRVLPEHALSRKIQDYDGAKVFSDPTNPKPLKVSSSKVDGAIRLFRDRVNRSAADEDEESFFDRSPTGLMFSNVFLRVDGDEIVADEPTPRHRARIGAEVPFDPEAEAPLFDQYLDSVFRGDDEADKKRRLLVEFFGASLFGIATRFKRTLVLADGSAQSHGDNGKSVIIKITSHILPKSATSKVSPQQFDDRFATTQLVGSRINHVGELPEEEILASDKLKGVISGDPIFAEHKYGDNFWFEPTAGHVFAANDLPKVKATDEAFWRRWVVLPFNNRFTPEGEPGQDRIENFDRKIAEQEIEGVMARLVEGVRRLLDRGHYLHPEGSKSKKRDWKTYSNPIEKFLIDECEYYEANGPLRVEGAKWWQHESRCVSASKLYQAYRSWASKTGHGICAQSTFGKRVKKLVDRKRRADGVVYRASLKPARDRVGDHLESNTAF